MACKTKSLLLALCVAALLAARSESHGLGDFTSGGEATTTPEMQTFFKPQAAAALPEALDDSMPAKPEAAAAATALPATTAAATTAGTAPSATPRRSVSVAAGVACGVAAVAVAGIAAAVAYVVRGRRRGTEVQLGSSP
jgi:hypothetical protein